MAQSKSRPIKHRPLPMQVSSKGLQHDGPLMRHRRSLLKGAAILPATAICMVMASTTAHAENIEWKGAAGGNWFDAANWQISPDGDNLLPGAKDNVFIYRPGPTRQA